MADRVALVTGADKGIGFATAMLLAQRGFHIILTARNEDKGMHAFRLVENMTGKAVFWELDVTNPITIHRVCEYVKRSFNRLDVLVNNAGIQVDQDILGSYVDFPKIKSTMDTNLFGALILAQAFLPLIIQNKYGRIVNVSSGLGQLSSMTGKNLAYRLSKTGLNVVTRVLADEMKDHNILINSVCPGWVRTDMGGPAAPRSADEAADDIVWAAMLPDGGPSGKFFRYKKEIDW